MSKKDSETIRQVLSILDSNNIDLKEFVEQSIKIKSQKEQTIYRSPTNCFDFWYGKGRKPKWLKSLLQQGYKLEELRV